MKSIVIKSILAVLLLLCILQMPYRYYTILRIAVTVGMILLNYEDNKEHSFAKFSFYLFVAVLFNPLLPVEFERMIWVVIDVMLAVLLIIWAVRQYGLHERNSSAFRNGG